MAKALVRTETELRTAVADILTKLQDQKERRRERLQRAFAVALHTDCHWNKVMWR